MITPMKKVTILCLDSDRQKSLEKLRDMGILHVTPLKNPTGSELNVAKNDMLRVQKALEAIPDAKKKTDALDSVSGESVVAEVQKLLEKRKNAEDRLSDAETAISRYDVFGNIDPESVRLLETRGIFVRLYIAPHGVPLEVDGDATVCSFAENSDGMCYAVLNFGSEPAKVKTAATPLALPAHSLEFYRREESEAKADLSAVEARFAELSREKGKSRNAFSKRPMPIRSKKRRRECCLRTCLRRFRAFARRLGLRNFRVLPSRKAGGFGLKNLRKKIMSRRFFPITSFPVRCNSSMMLSELLRAIAKWMFRASSYAFSAFSLR